MGHYTLLLNTCFLIVVCAFMVVHLQLPEVVDMDNHTDNSFSNITTDQDCNSLHNHGDYKHKCLYLKSNDPCVSQGYIDYLFFFYCKLGRFPLLGYTLLILWLLVLFYMLANTTCQYFCPSLENLSKFLRLSPTIAGVTLLSLGNGASDVFSSLVSFQGSGTQSIGFNTVLGGVSFVTCVVVGLVSISIRNKSVGVIKSAFVRDVCFLFLVLLFLFSILISGEINVLGAVGFTLLYGLYVVVVYVSSTRWKDGCGGEHQEGVVGVDGVADIAENLNVQLLNSIEKGFIDENEMNDVKEKRNWCLGSSIWRNSLYALEMPLYLPRRLTIPVVCEENWSKPFAVGSVILAPVLLCVIWVPFNRENFMSTFMIYGIGLLIGIVLGIAAILTTNMWAPPPRKWLFPWLAGGFLMSVTWSYISAQELVGLLVSIGYICGISPSILGLTVLAWGNSLGDLMTNLTLAINGGSEGAQIAISGCYAGPIFNTLVGLGLSLVTCTWSQYPQSVVITKDLYLWETMGFLVIGLIWALVVLIRKDMKFNGLLGVGLLVIYFVSLFLRLVQSKGSLDLDQF
ncbi:hypothetical protein HN51_033193 [Arachis hypogaea]|uniref:Sodium/calcium exchanger membrane region domain-containing protein n=1 Tax=Arachis hypogaea TaxID=3818 RepID=A0A445B1R9_ARAHY|nr:cation/calcium exchanger 2 isoform X1 [Arachis hypogaea]QHO17661.1 Cation/calcium exchanger [Arachis hypogaea]RYR32623.1 hypothetical protein Ahy_A10g047159 [Arachis hypogaea]